MKKENITAIIIAGIIALLYLTGLPCALFVNIQIADADPVCITLFFNILITMVLGIGLCRLLIPKFELGFTCIGLHDGLRKYGFSCALALAVPFLAFFIGLYPFEYRPTIWKVLIDGIIYYIGVGIIEEFFCRGLLQNSLEKLLQQKKNPQLNAVVISSAIFGLGHIFGMMDMPPLLVACKIAWAVGLGIYLGSIYVKTRNFWLIAGFHTVIDWCGLPFCFTTQRGYPTVSAVIVLFAFLILGTYGIRMLKK